jgi:Tol biopolymer transport system component
MNKKPRTSLAFRFTKAVLSVMLMLLIVLPLRAAQRQTDQIAFASNRDGDFEIYLMNLQGEIFAQLTDNNVTDLAPSWDPNGGRLAFTSNVDGDYDIYVVDIASGESVNLTNNGWDDLYPSWSPDGSQIAFTTNRDRNWEIYTTTPNGKSVTRLTNDPLYDGNSTWSPDGSQIAFVRDRESKREIYVMDADGGNVTQVTSNNLGDYSPSWSPEASARLIAYVSNHDNQGGTPEVYMVNLACLNEGDAQTCENSAENLTLLPRVGDIDPSWSRDGSQIIFASGRSIEAGSDAGTKLFVMNADGSDVQQLSTDVGDDRFPAWWSPS